MDFVFVSGKSLESVEPTSFEEAVNCKTSKNLKKKRGYERRDPDFEQK